MSNPSPASMNAATLESEIRSLSEAPKITPSQNARLDALLAEHVARKTRLNDIRDGLRTGKVHAELGYDSGVDSFSVHVKRNTDEMFATEARNRGEAVDLGLRALDHVHQSGVDLAPEVERSVRGDDRFAEMIRSQASPAYLSAWCKTIISGDPGRAMLTMTDAERSAMSRVSEARAMSGSVDTAGGFGVPVLVDPSIILTNDGTVNPIRRLARVVRGTGKTYRMITSAGSTASWDGEGTEVSDDAPVIASDEITSYTGRVFIPVSDELADDYVGLAEQLRAVLVDARDRLEATAFISGNGTTAPEGLLTNLDANTNVEVAVATAGALTAADFYGLFAALPPRYRSNATWLANLDVVNEIRQIGSDQLNTQTVSMTGDYSFRLLGRPVEECSDMPEWTGTTSAANVTVVGDFAAGYSVFDRMGASTVEVVPHLFGTNGRPTGQRGFYHAWRVGGAVTVPEAFRLLTNT